MPDSFFATARKNKRAKSATKPSGGRNGTTKRQKRQTQNDDSESVDEDELLGGVNDEDEEQIANAAESSEEEIQETPAEKRVRLAQAYLNKVKEESAAVEGFDAADLDRDLIAERLRHDEDELAGRMHLRVADSFDYSSLVPHRCRGHQLAITAVALADDGSVFFSASKDGSIVKWDAITFKKLHTFPGGRKGAKEYVGHTDHILCLAISSDGEYLASGGRDKLINIWSVKSNAHIVAFKQHKDAISGLAFRKGSHQLYSSSHDRMVKLWNIDERAYIETLFGHQDQITAIDTLRLERCTTTGGRDKTARIWKIAEESQLVYRGGATTGNSVNGSFEDLTSEGSLDCLAQVSEHIFLTGGDSGVISLWDINRKKPVFTKGTAHGYANDTEGNPSDSTTPKRPNWITSLASLRYSDLFVSGSTDGFVRVWKISSDDKSFEQVAAIPAAGVVNSLQVTTTSQHRTVLVIGLGQELRLGRWLRLKGGVKNCTIIVELPKKKN